MNIDEAQPLPPAVWEGDVDDDRFHDECGVFGIWGHPEAAKVAYLGLYALQHRGQESAGIVTSDGLRLHAHKGMGLVREVFTEDIIDKLPGHAAIGHTRYSTAGPSAGRNAQPFYVECNKGQLAVAHNGNLTNGLELRSELESTGSIFQATSDTEAILHLMARSRENTLRHALRESLLRLEGAYSLVLLAQDRLIIARDPKGFRPLAFGEVTLENGAKAYVAASETCAFDLIQARLIGEVEPGEMIIVTDEGYSREPFTQKGEPSQCVFEHVYFSRPDSVVFGRPVAESRENLGRILARESPVPADCVIPVPDSGVPAAIGYAAESGLPYKLGLIRNHYVGRTFIEPQQSTRDSRVRQKLNPVRHLVEGQRVILVDDSLVRGTTSRKIVKLMREFGAKEVHLRISCPPTLSPCYYGVDTPSKGELIAANHTVEDIRDFTGADSLAYLSIEGLHKAVGSTLQTKCCYACYTGEYPTNIVGIEEIAAVQARK